MADSTGMADLREENIEAMVKGFALQEFKLKQVVMVSNSNSWSESYYQETADELTAKGTRSIKGIPRLANFPYGEVSWTKKQAFMDKYGLEGVISWEDERTNNIDVIARTLLRIARGVAKAVDDEIWAVLSENETPTNINSVSISAGDEWDSATIANRDPVQNVLNALKEISIDNYDPYSNQSYLLLSPTDYANMLGNEKFLNMFKPGEVIKNGRVGSVLGLNLIVANSVTNDYAMVVIGQQCATWKTASPLTVVTINDPGIKKTVRAWEVGTTQLTNPEAVCLITNTQA